MGLYSKGFRFEGGGRHLIGLNRTGKSCRLRWVNYLHPGLKRGKLTPYEEKLVLDLHSKWGNRWSRIARKLPGRTDNEIKNYFRTHMRKKAQEEKRALASPASSSCQSSVSSNNDNNNNNKHGVDSHASKKAGEESFYDTGGPVMTVVECSSQVKAKIGGGGAAEEGFSMDDIWKDIELCEEKKIVYDGKSEEGCNLSSPPPTSWEYSSDPLWVMDEESVLFPPTSDPYFSCFAQSTSFLTTG